VQDILKLGGNTVKRIHNYSFSYPKSRKRLIGLSFQRLYCYTGFAMPELPEVETIRIDLQPWVLGRRFVEIKILDNKLMKALPAGGLQSMVGQNVQNLERRGKYLIFRLSSNQSLIVHLRMTGSLVVASGEVDKYTRASFLFTDGVMLVFNDMRRLGVMYLVEDAEAVVGRLGVEPLSDRFTIELLQKLMKRHHIPVKVALLDQSIIAGIGNMYADEALFAAKINPLVLTDALSTEQFRNLYSSVGSILSAAIKNKGASVDTYIRPGGETGIAQNQFKVAHRKGQPCYTCGTPVQRIMLRGRGSYYCPSCQPDLNTNASGTSFIFDR